MKKGMGAALCLALMLFVSTALAGGNAPYSPGTLMAPPVAVLDHIGSRWPEYELEDYCEVRGTSQGDYGFALLHKGNERLLVGYHKENGEMRYWLKNAAAVPQGEPEAWFAVASQRDGDGLGFTVIRLDDAGESYEQSVTYRWEDGGFRLTRYKKGTIYNNGIGDGFVEFFNESIWEQQGIVYGEVQTDLRYVSFATLPGNIEEGRRVLTAAPEVDAGAFTAQQVKFTGGQKFPVYTGPGKLFARSGNGKGLVSTNDWIEVYGEYDGYILIQYEISSSQYRFGWIEKGALPKGASIPAMRLNAGRNEQTLMQDVVLTDDPLVSQKAIAALKAGTQLSFLAHLDGAWEYVMVEVDGKMMCGFIPSGTMSNG